MHRPRRRQAGRRLRIDRAGNLGQARDRRVLARRRHGLLERRLVDVGEAHPLHRVEVVEIAPELLEAVRGRQRVGVVAEVVLAELAGGVAEVVEELGDRRGAGLEVGRAARQLRRDHAGPERVHAGEEGVAPGGAALLGVVVGEERAFLADAVDVRRLADHQAAVVDRRLHVADVVAHDEEDVGLGLLLRRHRPRGGGDRHRQPPHGDKRAETTPSCQPSHCFRSPVGLRPPRAEGNPRSVAPVPVGAGASGPPRRERRAPESARPQSSRRRARCGSFITS